MLRTPLLVAVPLLSTSAAAQWVALDGDPSGALWSSDAAIVHDDGRLVRGRAAPGAAWVDLAPSGSEVLGLSDHLAVLGPSSAPVLWDARSGELVPLDEPGASLVTVRVEDELALVVTVDARGQVTAHAYSARVGGWSRRAAGDVVPTPFDVVTGDAVAALRTPGGYLGYGAASGLWGELALDPTGDFPEAFGHVAGARLFDPVTQTGEDRYAAFSGFRGQWVVSDELHYSSIPRFGRGSIAVRLETPIVQRFRPSYFDGHRAEFTVGDQVHVDVSALDLTTGRVHFIDDEIGGQDVFEWFTPQVGDEVGVLSGQLDRLELTDDLALLVDIGAAALVAVGGLVPGEPAVAPVSGPPEVLGAGRALALVGTPDGTVRAFSARLGQWSAPLSVSGAPQVAVGDTAALVTDGGQVHGISAHGSTWVPLGAGTADELLVGPAVQAARVGGTLWFFDARHASWIDGGPLEPGLELRLGADHIVAFDADGGLLRAWSAADPGWRSAEGVAAPLASDPETAGRLSWVFDAQGRLWSFGAGSALEAVGRWPAEVDPALRPETVGSGAARLDAVVAGGAGELAVVLLDGVGRSGGVALPPLGGLLELGPSPLIVSDPLDLGTSGTARASIPVPPGLGTGLTLWLQPVLVDPVAFALRFGSGAARVALF